MFEKTQQIVLSSVLCWEKQNRVCLDTTSHQIAKEKLRQFESAKLRGADNPLPTKTLLSEIVGKYVTHIRNHKTAKSAQTDKVDQLPPDLEDSAREAAEECPVDAIVLEE